MNQLNKFKKTAEQSDELFLEEKGVKNMYEAQVLSLLEKIEENTRKV